MTAKLQCFSPVNTDIDYYQTFCICDVSFALVVREKICKYLPYNAEHQARKQLVPLFNAFGMARLGFEPTTSRIPKRMLPY